MFALSDVRFAGNSAIVGDVEGQPFFFFFASEGQPWLRGVMATLEENAEKQGDGKKLDKVLPIVAEIYPT